MNHDENIIAPLSRSNQDPPEPSAEGSLPLVHTQESKVQSENPHSYRRFLLSGSSNKAEKVIATYKSVDNRDGTNRTSNLLRCRTNAWFVRHRDTHEIRVASSRCHLRWCPLCERTDRFAVQSAVAERIRTMVRPRFITLTLKHSSRPLSDQIDHLYDSFRRLRRYRAVKTYITGGIWFFQLKKIESSNEWHPHIHVLCGGRFFPQEELKQLWYKASSGSFIVDIRAVKDIAKSAEYVARYATCPANMNDLDEADRLDVYDSLFGRKIKGTWGNLRDVKLTAQPPADAADWEYMGPYQLIHMMRKTGPLAMIIYDSWVHNLPCDIDPLEMPPPIETSPPPIETISTYRQHLLFRV